MEDPFLTRNLLSTTAKPIDIGELIELAAAEDRLQQARMAELLRFGGDSGIGFGDARLFYWARLPSWTIEETVALSFGKDPSMVNWEACSSKLEFFPFCRTFAARYMLACRWQEAGKLQNPLSPVEALEWLIRVMEPHTAELGEAVALAGNVAIDWCAEYVEQAKWVHSLENDLASERLENSRALAEKDEQLAASQASLDETRGLFADLIRVIESLEADVTRLNQDVTANEASSTAEIDEPMDERERGTFLKLLLVMAVKGYAFKPLAGASPTPKEIEGDTAEFGIRVSAETISNKLREAADRFWDRLTE